MAHETHNDNSKVKVAFGSAFWLIAIIVGLFIGALNFIQVESHHEGEGKEGTEMHEGGEAKEAKEAKGTEEHAAATEEHAAAPATEATGVKSEAKPAATEPAQPEHK